jgi:hypothetical protein
VSPIPSSPVPKTRVEKVSDEPSHGEVPGTEAYRQRQEDAMPDEIAIIPDTASGHTSSSASFADTHTVPQTVVSEVPGSTGSHTEDFKERIAAAHRADASPDAVVLADDSAVEESGEDPASSVKPAVSSTGTGSEDDGTRV